MGRKNLLVDLIDAELTAVNSDTQGHGDTEKRPPQPTLGSRGAVGAMSRSLEIISAEREAAKALSERIAAGQSLVEIDAQLIEASFVPDRMRSSDNDRAALADSIRERGQLVPVLLRPHPVAPGHFQVAYGHRRVQALRELGRPVRAIIRDLTDEQLVVAQGKENSDRKDLSFIERAAFAAKLEDRKFGRETIMAALSVDKTELSRLISVYRAIPNSVVDAIGAAPKTGRRRWLLLAERLADHGARKQASTVLGSVAFNASNSDARFAQVLAVLTPRKDMSDTHTTWASDDGRKIALIKRSADRFTLAVDEKAAPAFGDFLIERLPELYRAFREERQSS